MPGKNVPQVHVRYKSAHRSLGCLLERPQGFPSWALYIYVEHMFLYYDKNMCSDYSMIEETFCFTVDADPG